MPTLEKYAHVIVFSVLVIVALCLQFGPFSRGWPIPLQNAQNSSLTHWFVYGSVRLLINSFPCIMILSLGMLPFAYDSDRTFSIASLIVLTVAASIAISLLPPEYVKKYHQGEHALIYALTIMAVNGLLQRTFAFLNNYIDLPDLRTSHRRD